MFFNKLFKQQIINHQRNNLNFQIKKFNNLHKINKIGVIDAISISKSSSKLFSTTTNSTLKVAPIRPIESEVVIFTNKQSRKTAFLRFFSWTALVQFAICWSIGPAMILEGIQKYYSEEEEEKKEEEKKEEEKKEEEKYEQKVIKTDTDTTSNLPKYTSPSPSSTIFTWISPKNEDGTISTEADNSPSRMIAFGTYFTIFGLFLVVPLRFYTKRYVIELSRIFAPGRSINNSDSVKISTVSLIGTTSSTTFPSSQLIQPKTWSGAIQSHITQSEKSPFLLFYRQKKKDSKLSSYIIDLAGQFPSLTQFNGLFNKANTGGITRSITTSKSINTKDLKTTSTQTSTASNSFFRSRSRKDKTPKKPKK